MGAPAAEPEGVTLTINEPAKKKKEGITATPKVSASGKPALMDKQMVFRSRKAGMPLRPVRQAQAAEEDTDKEPDALDMLLNSLGVPMRLDLPPLMPSKDKPLSDYGLSVGVRLQLQFLIEGGCVFLIMFLLACGALVDNTHRNDLRMQCREAASTDVGYLALVEGTITQTTLRADPTWSYLAPLVSKCGYLGKEIRRFNNSKIDQYQPNNVYMLRTGLGACQEYKLNTSSHEMLPRVFPSVPILVQIGDSDMCFGKEGAHASAWCQLLGIIVFALFLIRLRYTAQIAASDDDKARITTADYALRFAGLDETITADELTEKLYADLDKLGFPRSKINHIEVGRHCEDEIKIIEQMASLDVKAEEIEAKAEALGKRGMPVAAQEAQMTKLAETYLKAKNRMKELIDEPDMATGHAFVVFNYEVDRNKCASLWPRDDNMTFYERLILRVEKEKDKPAPEMSCASKGSRFTSKAQMFWRPNKWVHMLGITKEREKPTLVEVTSAPEPEEVLWANLQLSDEFEAKVEAIGWALISVVMAFGLVLILVIKVIQQWQRARLTDQGATKGTILMWTLLLSLLASFTTITFAFLLKRLIVRVAMKEGQDTRTEEERAIFSKLSVAYVINSVVVPLVLGAILTVPSHLQLVDQTWYETGGVISQGLILILASYGTDGLKLFGGGKVLLDRYVLGRKTYSQSALDRLWRPPKMHIGLQYSDSIRTSSLGLIYGPIFPPAYAIAAGGLFFSWFCTRGGLRFWYEKPSTIDQDMLMELRRRLGQSLAISIFVQIVSLHAATRPGEFSAAGVLYIGGPLVWAIYTFLPLRIFKVFQEADQLSSEELDTKGIAFDEVTEKTGFNVTRYSCPLLTAAGVMEQSNVGGRRASNLMHKVTDSKAIAAAAQAQLAQEEAAKQKAAAPAAEMAYEQNVPEKAPGDKAPEAVERV